MPLSLSEMQSSPDVGRPERTFPICVAPKLAAELDEADKALFAAEDALAAAQGDDRPKRISEKSPVPDLERAADEAADRSDAIRARMEDLTVAVHLRAVENGLWRQWVAAHPAREEATDPAGSKRDARWAGGLCNIDALIADLGFGFEPSGERWITAYGDEPPTDEAWAFVAGNAAPGDLTTLASVVVGMQEQGTDLGKSRRAWLSDRRSANDSE